MIQTYRADFAPGDYIEVRAESHHIFAMMTVLGSGIGWSAYRDPRMVNANFDDAVAVVKEYEKVNIQDDECITCFACGGKMTLAHNEIAYECDCGYWCHSSS